MQSKKGSKSEEAKKNPKKSKTEGAADETEVLGEEEALDVEVAKERQLQRMKPQPMVMKIINLQIKYENYSRWS